MSNFLINTLLSHHPDPENLFSTLCWPSTSRPDIEKIEALTVLIKELSNKSQEEHFICKVQSVIWNQCMPLMQTLSSADDGGKDMLSAVCGLFAVCVSTCQTHDVPEKVSHVLLPVLLTRDDGNHETSRFDVDVAIEVTAVLLSSISYDRDIISRTLSCTLCCVKDLSDSVISKIIVRIWFTILKSCDKDSESEVLHQIWDDLLSWHQRDQTESVSARVLLCLTALSDHLYSSETSQTRPDPRRSQRFFRAVQTGLTHKDSVTRKRALYLLTRCVALAEIKKEDVFTSEEPNTDEILFRWTPEKKQLLRDFWEDYALVLETLEENQIHVIRPVLNRIDMLVETTATDIQGGLFSPSWLLCVYQRMFHSENKAVMKEGVNHLLELKALHRPAFALAFSQFVIGPLMDVLAESSLYHRAPQQNIRDCPELGLKLQMFMVNFFKSLPEENRGSVLLQLIQRLGSRHWCAVPLLFLSQALSCLSPCPLLGSDGLHAFREVLRCTMITHQVLLRGASQCFLLRAALCLTDVSAVSLDEIFGFLLHFRADESLCRGTALWKELCNWLQANEGCFRLTNGYSGSSEELHSLCILFLLADQTGSLPDPSEAELLVRTVLLAADLQQTRSEEPGLELLLQPLLDVLQRLSTNVYLVLQKTDKSLQLLLRLLQLHRRRSDTEKENVLCVYNSDPVDSVVLKDWGRIVAQFIRDQWTCLSFLQKSAGTLQAPVASEVLRAAVDALALLPGHLVLPVLDFMASVVVHCDESLCTEAICASWKAVQALSTNPHDFWSTLQGFVRLAFHQGLLQEKPERPLVPFVIKKAYIRSGVFNVLIQHCCETWLPCGAAEGLQADADAEISKSKVRYYSNSIQHRVKNRVWQTLLLLLHKLRPAGFCSNQASVKYLIEWTLILVLHQNPSRIQNLWNCFSLDHEKTKTSICTFLSVLVHLNVLLPKLAVEVSLQWCFSHNFSIRLYALLALKRVWELEDARVLPEEHLGGLTTVVQACLQQAEAMQNTGNAMKNWSRIQDHFFFSVFNPIRDYSVETIFQIFPLLSELAEDEWLPPWKFECFVDFPICAALPLKNPVTDLCELQPGDWIQQDKGGLEQEERWAEVQKKITPWKLSVQEQEPELMAQQRAARLGKLTSNLLVVASLIDKPTNLGGLCRTCEIFGAKALVLDSLRHINDKQFQVLSVSSELWLPMLEVKPAELSDFLQLKKREGYWVIGVEQTSNSQSLQDYMFPERSLLLLGNEREGIPANLLQLVDVCVEIPQHGITRSLNVHVSAALLVWEYTRQHLGQNARS
uniref:tRNA (guanosine(18)-2'-O)-methyltransferase TARBP1 n=1 Tax=Cyprinus carpio TaxID=7962 RepID=A0A8C1KU42_CYPCA